MVDPNKVNVLAEAHGKTWSVYQADCVDFAAQLPDNCIDCSIYSPPFSSLFTYSDSICDMGNCADDAEFFLHYNFLIAEMLRITKPGRVSCVHCKQLANLKWQTGRTGMRDFRGEIIRAHVEAGWDYHSEVVIWKDPVVEMQRTKALGLLWKQLRKDSTKSKMGMPDYVITFRKPEGSDDESNIEPVEHTKDDFPVEQWQKWASPIWMDIRQGNVLNGTTARDQSDERHICPLQLDVIQRCLTLWSNPGDRVFSPFMGIGSEGYQSIDIRRRFIGTELKESYFKTAVAYLTGKEAQSDDLFNSIAMT